MWGFLYSWSKRALTALILLIIHVIPGVVPLITFVCMCTGVPIHVMFFLKDDISLILLAYPTECLGEINSK